MFCARVCNILNKSKTNSSSEVYGDMKRESCSVMILVIVAVVVTTDDLHFHSVERKHFQKMIMVATGSENVLYEKGRKEYYCKE